MLVCIVLGYQNRSKLVLNRRTALAIQSIVLLVAVSLISAFPIATLQWFIQVAILCGFAWSLIRFEVPVDELITWSILSMIPHALLAIQQGITQNVIGSTLFGIAAQDPLTRGVAVVEANGIRFLRAYGGLPYPNILGGFFAFALPASLWLTLRDKRWSIASCLFAVALILTHSRSAWIACAFLLMTLGWSYRKSLPDKRVLFTVLCSLIVALFWQWPLINTRVTAEGRLEERSVSERLAGNQSGIAVFRDHPWTGIGVNTFSEAFPEYALPHSVPLLILAEVGLIGSSGLVILGYLFCSSAHCKRYRIYCIILPLAILGLLDHYLWSYWSGQALFILVMSWTCLGVDRAQKIG